MIAKELKIGLNYTDIRRAHRLGKKKRNGKPRPIIIRLQSKGVQRSRIRIFVNRIRILLGI